MLDLFDEALPENQARNAVHHRGPSKNAFSCRSTSLIRRATSPKERQEKWDALRRTMKTFRTEPWFDLVVVDVDRFDRFMSMSTEHFYTFLEKGPLANGDFDKVCQELNQCAEVRCPVLAGWGENDEFLPPHVSATFLKSCLRHAGHEDATFRIVPECPPHSDLRRR